MRPLLLAAIGATVALAICELIGAYALIPTGACALFALCIYFLLRRRTDGASIRAGAAIICCAALVAAGWHWAYTELFYSPAVELVGTQGRYEATVRDYPTHYEYGSSVEVELIGAGANARARLWISDYIELSPGDILSFEGTLDKPDSTTEFDFLNYYRSHRIFLDGEVSDVISVKIADRIPLRFLPTLIRHEFGNKLDILYSGDANAIARALCIGDRSAMSNSLRLAVRAGGLSHLLAISGLHITLLCGALVSAFGSRRRAKLGASFFALLTVLVFVLVCGAPASVVRAFVMHGMLMLSLLIKRDSDPLSALGASLLLLLIICPYAINDAGLQLSFLATLGLLLHFGKAREWTTEHITKRLPEKSPAIIKRMLQRVCDTVLLTLIANLYTAPLISLLFGSLPLYGVLSNLPALVLTPIALIGGLLNGVLGFISMPAAQAVAVVISPAVSALSGVSYFFARLPFSLIDMSSPYNQAALALSYILIIIWRLSPENFRGKVCAPLICSAFIAAFAFGEFERRTDAMDVTVLDVGQGQSLLFMSGSKTALIDCGGNCYDGAGCRAAETLMLAGRRRIDTLVLTHYHYDHANGVEDLLDFIDVKKLYSPEPEPGEHLTELFDTENTEIQYITSENASISLGNAEMTVYRPVRRETENESGVYVTVSTGEFDTLITGDLGSVSERIILEREPLHSVEMILAGHHGSKGSTGDELLEQLTPQTAMISVGKNSYGHPAPATLYRLATHNVSVYRTDLNGNINIRVGKGGK